MCKQLVGSNFDARTNEDSLLLRSRFDVHWLAHAVCRLELVLGVTDDRVFISS